MRSSFDVPDDLHAIVAVKVRVREGKSKKDRRPKEDEEMGRRPRWREEDSMDLVKAALGANATRPRAWDAAEERNLVFASEKGWDKSFGGAKAIPSCSRGKNAAVAASQMQTI
jgi:hypothetical protein